MQIQTRENEASVSAFLDALADAQQRDDAYVLLDMMTKVSGAQPKMWGKSLIGFGNMVMRSPATGREVEWFRIGFSPRKANLSLYLTMQIKDHEKVLSRLGPHKTGVGCLYIKRLADVDMKVLRAIVETAAKHHGG